MPWVTPSLAAVRTTTRNNVLAALRTAAMVPNSVTRVMSDAMSGLAHLCLLYVDWLAKQLLPDSAETEWLDRHGQIWLRNADNTRGRKAATFAEGVITVTGASGRPVPGNTQLSGPGNILYETINPIAVGDGATSVGARAIDPGIAGNLNAGDTMAFVAAVPGVDGLATVVMMTGGTDQESDDELRTRVLDRIQKPPMGGDADDYVLWALAVAGVTRAWCSPNEMGVGSVTVRFMCDDLEATLGGFPQSQDIAAVTAYLDTVRPVTVEDFFCEAPIRWPIDFTISNLEVDTADDTAARAAIAVSVANMLFEKAAPASSLGGVRVPATTIYAAWVSDAILNSVGVVSFDLIMADAVPPNNGSMAVLGTITYAA